MLFNARQKYKRPGLFCDSHKFSLFQTILTHNVQGIVSELQVFFEGFYLLTLQTVPRVLKGRQKIWLEPTDRSPRRHERQQQILGVRHNLSTPSPHSRFHQIGLSLSLLGLLDSVFSGRCISISKWRRICRSDGSFIQQTRFSDPGFRIYSTCGRMRC